MAETGYDEYQVDLVICMDVTASMKPIIDNAKRNAIEFGDRLERAARERGMSVGDLRVRMIPFRDLDYDGSDAIWDSPWFEIPRDTSDFASFVNDLSARGGGSEPESGLEALWLAMNSSWRDRGAKRRSIIVMMTDASAHDLGTRYEFEQQEFPTPRTLDELKMRWGCVGDEEESVFGTRNFDTRRLVLLTPDSSPWSEVGGKFERTIWLPSLAGAGLSELEWDEICKIVVRSI